MIPKNFWLQPANGFTDKTKGLSIETIKKKENELGIVFPDLYKQLMQQQNGGGIRYSAFIEDGEEIGPFVEISCNEFGVNTFLDYLKLTKNEDDLKEMYNQFAFCYPERLVLFADFHGHGGLFFDYGWLQEKQQDSPEVVLINDYGNEFLHYEQAKRFATFETFFKALRESEGNSLNILISKN